VAHSSIAGDLAIRSWHRLAQAFRGFCFGLNLAMKFYGAKADSYAREEFILVERLGDIVVGAA